MNARIEWYAKSPGFGNFGIRNAEGTLIANVQTFDEQGLCFILATAPELHAACEQALATLEASGGDPAVIASLRSTLQKARQG